MVWSNSEKHLVIGGMFVIMGIVTTGWSALLPLVVGSIHCGMSIYYEIKEFKEK